MSKSEHATNDDKSINLNTTGFSTKELLPSEAEVLRLYHELEVHQIELELQNEELKLAKEQAEAAKEKYSELYNFAPMGYFTLSKEGIIIELNLCGSQMLGSDRSFLINKRFGVFVSDDTKQIFNLFFAKVFMVETKETCEVTILADGEQPIHVQITGIVSENKEQLLVNMVDITVCKRAEEELQTKNDQLVKINMEKDTLYSIIAHDLRSPFHGFLGLTEVIANEATEFSAEKIAQFGKNMNKTANNLYTLLKNLLEWAQLQKNTMEFNPLKLPLSTIIEKNIELVCETSNKKDITITNMLKEPHYIFADEIMINSIILNLLSNAVKFTGHSGLITIKANRTENQMVEVAISDNGVGLTQKELDNLFVIGGKVRSQGTDGELSTGLGLLLCKEFVTINGGQIWVKSDKKYGSTFYFTLKCI